MRVVFIGDFFHGQGNDSHLRELAKSTDLTIYGNGPQPDFAPSRVLERVQLKAPAGPRFWLYKGLPEALNADKPDVVHVLTEPWQMLALQVTRWARRSPRTAFVMHNSDRNWWTVPAARRAARRMIARRTFARADGFVSESSGGVLEAERFGLPPGTVTAAVIMNPRDPVSFSPPMNGDRPDAREQLGLPRDGIGVGFLGRLSIEKGPILFVDGFKEAAAQLTGQVWAAVAGTGPLEEEVAARAAGSNLSCVGLLDYPGDVATFLHAIDILVMPSIRVGQWEEQAPRAVVEAMLSGCIVVGTSVGGIPEMLGGTGIVVEGQSPAAVGAGIVSAVTDPNLAQLRASARQRAIDIYSGQSAATALREVWERSLHQREARA